MREHVAKLIVEGVGVLVRTEIPEALAPVRPTTREAIEHLARIILSGRSLTIPTIFILWRNPGLSKIFLRPKMSVATWDQSLGTMTFVWLKTNAPIGLMNLRFSNFIGLIGVG